MSTEGKDRGELDCCLGAIILSTKTQQTLGKPGGVVGVIVRVKHPVSCAVWSAETRPLLWLLVRSQPSPGKSIVWSFNFYLINM